MRQAIQKHRCPHCGRMRPSYLIASHIAQCTVDTQQEAERQLTFLRMPPDPWDDDLAILSKPRR